MTNQEKVKQSQKIYKVWHSQEHTIGQKIKEFLIEILIIVFSVTLSISVYSWNENRLEQKEVKQFLQDLKTDLIENNISFEKTKKLLIYGYKGYNYFYEISNKNLQNDSLSQQYMSIVQTKVKLVTHKSQYEGYKFSGKLNKIQNKKLVKDLIELYQRDIEILESDFAEYNRFHTLFQTEFANFIEFDDRGNLANYPALMKNKKVKIYLLPLAKFEDPIMDIDACIRKANKIISEIDQEYEE